MSEKKLKVFSREPEDGKYPNGLAYSVHMALEDGNDYKSLHNNYGILFPKASINEQNVIVPKFARDFRVAKSLNGGTFYITGVDVLADGTVNTDSYGFFWCWSTKDFISFEEYGLISIDKILELSGLNADSLRAGESVIISEDTANKVKTYRNPITFKEIKNDTVFYSDGSNHKKNISGYPNLKFPLLRGFGDPVILLWEDEYYFIATNDNVNDIGLYVRKAHELDDLFNEETPMHLILDRDEKRGLIQTFWAPEFHFIGGDLYILFAVSNENWGPQSHLMKLKHGGNILNAGDWEDPVKVKLKDGKPLGTGGITLDMTCVKSGNRFYYAWSYREHIGSPMDSGSMIMIGEFSPNKPDMLISDPVCLTRPLYGFENVRGTINNEGPYALYHDGTIYLAYSGGDARGYLYTVGMLTAKDGADLCDINAWEKAKTPVLSFASVPGEFGPGHNSFFKDRDGDTWIAFHAVRSYEEKVISDGIRRVHFDATGRPRFDLAREEDLPEKYRK